MSYPRIINAVFNTPWAIQRPWLGSIFTALHSHVFAGEQSVPAAAREEAATLAQIRAGHAGGRQGNFLLSRWGKAADGRPANLSAQIHTEAMRHAIAAGGSYAAYEQKSRELEAALPAAQTLVIFGSGILGKHLSAMEEDCSGGLSVDRLQSALSAARSDDKIGSVVIHLDSPGGVVYGIPETAALVRALSAEKHVVAYCDSLSASAAYWIASACDYFYVTPSAEVGSIGVYSAVVDYTEWCTKQGIKVELIKDGTFKGAGFPGTSLTDEQRNKIQSDVLRCSAAFKADVRAGRGAGVTDETMQGQCFGSAEAVAVGLADTVVNDLEAVLADLAQAPSAAASRI